MLEGDGRPSSMIFSPHQRKSCFPSSWRVPPYRICGKHINTHPRRLKRGTGRHLTRATLSPLPNVPREFDSRCGRLTGDI